MKKNDKRMLVAMLAMAMALSMTACSEEPAEDTSSSESESSVSEQVSEPEVSDLEVEDGTSSDAETETSDPAADNASRSAADTGSSTASQPAADTTTSQPAADQGSSQAQQPATSGQDQTQTQAPATTQTNSSSGKGPLAKYAVNVQDSSTLATSVVGETLNGKSAYYFYSADGKLLGSIPIDYLMQIIGDNGLSYAEDDEQKAWFVENFNIYRGLEGGNNSSGSSSPSSSSNGSSSSDFDVDEFCEEVVHLTNIEREAAGLDPLVMDDTAMEYAQIRAEELAINYSHTRPNNESKSLDGLYFIENIAYGQKTPEEVVSDWMASSGHRAAMLSDYSNYGNCLGVGVYEEDRTFYWVLEFILWDANA